MADPDIAFGIDLGPIVERLEQLSYFTSVDDIQAGVEVLGGETPFVPPAAFVAVSSEDFAKNRLATGGHAQQAVLSLSVLMGIPAERADRAVGDEVERARRLVLAQLAGWQPPGAIKALAPLRYRIRLTGEGLVWPEWQFVTAWDFTY